MLGFMRVSRLAAGLLLAFPLATAAQGADPTNAVAGGGSLPRGWHAHTDRDAPLANVKFVVMGAGYHATLGPAAIFWRDADSVNHNLDVHLKTLEIHRF